MIALVGAGLVQATRLIRHLAGLRQGRIEMERFVHEFNATVIRAEAGIKGLRMAARDSGDDLEKLVEKALLVRDELHLYRRKRRSAERLSQSRQQSGVKPGLRQRNLAGLKRKQAPAPPAQNPDCLDGLPRKKPETKDARPLLRPAPRRNCFRRCRN